MEGSRRASPACSYGKKPVVGAENDEALAQRDGKSSILSADVSVISGILPGRMVYYMCRWCAAGCSKML